MPPSPTPPPPHPRSARRPLLPRRRKRCQNMRNQWRTFRVQIAPREGQINPSPPAPVRHFDNLEAAKHPSTSPTKKGKPLLLRHLFLREGADTFIINLEDKKGLNFVCDVLGQASDPDFIYSLKEPVETVERGEKFAPGEREAKGRCKATIEHEAARTTAAARLPSAEFVLIDASHKITYYMFDSGAEQLTKSREARCAQVDDGATADTAQLPHERAPGLYMHKSDDSKASGGNGSTGARLQRSLALKMTPAAGVDGGEHQRTWSEPAHASQAGSGSGLHTAALAAAPRALDLSHCGQGGAANSNGAGGGSGWGCHQSEELQRGMGEGSPDKMEVVVNEDSPSASGFGVEGSTCAKSGERKVRTAVCVVNKIQQMREEEPDAIRDLFQHMLESWKSSKSYCDVASMASNRGLDENGGLSGGGGEVSRQASDDMIEAVARHALQSVEGAAGTELIQDQAEAVVHDATESGEVPVAAGTELLQAEAVEHDATESGEVQVAAGTELIQNQAGAMVHDATESGEIPVAAGTELLQNRVVAVVRDTMGSGEIRGGIELTQKEDELQDFAANITALLLEFPSSPVAGNAAAEEGKWPQEPIPLPGYGLVATTVSSPARTGLPFGKGRTRALMAGLPERLAKRLRRTESDGRGTGNTPSARLCLNKSA